MSSLFLLMIYAQHFSSSREHLLLVLLVLPDGWGRVGEIGEGKGDWKKSAISISKISLPFHKQFDF